MEVHSTKEASVALVVTGSENESKQPCRPNFDVELKERRREFDSYLRLFINLLTAVGFGKPPLESRLRQRFYIAYGVLVFTVASLCDAGFVAVCARQTVDGNKFNTRKALPIVTVVYSAQDLCGIMLAVKLFRRGKMHVFCDLWTRIDAEAAISANLRRRFAICEVVVVVAFTLFGAVGTSVYYLLGCYDVVAFQTEHMDLAKFFGVPHQLNFVVALKMSAMSITLGASIGIFAGSVYLVASLAKALAVEIASAARGYDSPSFSNGDAVLRSISNWSTRHVNLIEISDHLSATFSVFVAAIMVMNIPLQIMLLYILMVDNHVGGALKAMTCVWEVLMMCELWCVFSAANLYAQFKGISKAFAVWYAKVSAANIANLKMNQIDKRALGFLARCQAHEVGVSAAGFFLITRECIVTIVSIVITYFVVLIQFAE